MEIFKDDANVDGIARVTGFATFLHQFQRFQMGCGVVISTRVFVSMVKWKSIIGLGIQAQTKS